jgi:AraC family transcriptional regulator
MAQANANQAMTTDFGVEETHGILWRPENRIYAKSDGRGWSSLYASTQRETPYAAEYRAVQDHLIILHLDGPVGVRRRLAHDESRKVVPPGGLFILPGGIEFGVELEGELDSLHVYLRRRLVQEVAAELGVDKPGLTLIPRLGERDLLIERLALGVREALTDDDDAAGIYVDYLSRALAARLLREHSNAAPQRGEPARGGLTDAQRSLVIDFMEAHLDQPVALAEMAAACGLSPTHFARQFKAALGAPPHQHLMQLRVERAKRLLQQGPTPIVEVALACGFTHQEHLTRIFRRMTGMTPASFRRAAQS